MGMPGLRGKEGVGASVSYFYKPGRIYILDKRVLCGKGLAVGSKFMQHGDCTSS